MAAALVTCGAAAAQDMPVDATTGGDSRYQDETIDVGGLKRSYLVHEPPGWYKRQPLPVLLMFHGGGGTAQGNDKICQIVDFCDAHNVLLVCPVGIKKHWNDGRKIANVENYDDVGFVDKLIDDLSRRWNVDKSHIYAMGMSNGGFFSQYLALKLPQKIAAVASVVATLSQDVYDSEKPSRPVPIMFILGTADPLVPFEGGEITIGPLHRGKTVPATTAINFWVKANGCQPTPVVTELPQVAPLDPTSVTREVFEPGAGGGGGAEVVAYIIKGGGHTWPGGKQYLPVRIVGRTSSQMNANDVIWKFFEQHHLGEQSPTRYPLPGTDTNQSTMTR